VTAVFVTKMPPTLTERRYSIYKMAASVVRLAADEFLFWRSLFEVI
jgi:hypothetical protein